jgi:hypothetical protein
MKDNKLRVTFHLDRALETAILAHQEKMAGEGKPARMRSRKLIFNQALRDWLKRHGTPVPKQKN